MKMRLAALGFFHFQSRCDFLDNSFLDVDRSDEFSDEGEHGCEEGDRNDDDDACDHDSLRCAFDPAAVMRGGQAREKIAEGGHA